MIEKYFLKLCFDGHYGVAITRHSISSNLCGKDWNFSATISASVRIASILNLFYFIVGIRKKRDNILTMLMPSTVIIDRI